MLLVRWRKSYGAVIDESLKTAVVPNVPNPAVVAARRKYLKCRRTVLCYQNAFVGVAVKPVPGELIESRGDWSLVQPSTVPPPVVRIERYWCHRSVNSRLWQASFQPRMRSLAIKVMLKIEQLRLEIGRRPE